MNWRRISGTALLWMLLATGLRAQAMPPGLPSLDIRWYRDTAMCGHTFLSTVRFVLPMSLHSAAMILDRRGELVWYLGADDNLFNFSPQPNGRLSFNLNDEWYELDSSLSLQTVPTCSGIAGDFHDYIHLPDGRRFELCNADTIMDLRAYRTYAGQPGDSLATVRYNVVEERNALGQLMRTWRAIDYFTPADVDSQYFYYPWFLELTHTNSMDYDGQHLLLSHRSNHEVTLIDWPSRQILWRLGGRNNDFFFLNDAGFRSQHDARFVGGNRISIYDNRSLGNITTPRAVVYELDTLNWVATRLYERVQQGATSPSMGSFRQLPNGDALVCWGQVVPEQAPNVSYYLATGQKVAEWHFQDQHLAYRITCEDLPFPIDRPHIYCTRQNNQLILQVSGNHPSYLWNTGATDSLIVAADTGYYQVYVPSGVGFAGSNVLHITDLNANCPSTPVADPVVDNRPPKLLGRYDLLGRPVTEPQPGQVIIERYDKGRSRKVLSN